MSLKAWLGIDKIQKLGQIVKEIGGVKAVLKKRYLCVFSKLKNLEKFLKIFFFRKFLIEKKLENQKMKKNSACLIKDQLRFFSF